MKRSISLCCVFILVSLLPQAIVFSAPDTVLVGQWDFNDPMGCFIHDSSSYGNDGAAIGTSVVEAPLGLARSFNGLGDYVTVPEYPGGSLDFLSNEGFSIELWFRTTQVLGDILRKGLAPVPGYMLVLRDGHLQGMIGDRADGNPPSALVPITSTNPVNDGQWHHAEFVRDREARVLRLYIDGEEAATPVDDPIPFALATSYGLFFGRWANETYPEYFQGSIDKIRIRKFVLPPSQSDTLALWHFDDSGQIIVDSSPHANNGMSYGTSIVPGISGNARAFSGYNSFIEVPNAEDNSLSFAPDSSFTISAWFKTTSEGHGWILRKGLADDPGYAIGITAGHIDGIIGNKEHGIPPDTLLHLRSERTYNDGLWHHVSLIRDRALSKLFMFVDDSLACTPDNDTFPYALENNQVLTFGRWANWEFPEYYQGAIDEVSIHRGAMYPLADSVPQVFARRLVAFGAISVGGSKSLPLYISNGGGKPLSISGIEIGGAMFSCDRSSFAIGAYSTDSVLITYKPTSAGLDTASLIIHSDEPGSSGFVVRLSGTGWAPIMAPLITGVNDVAGDNGRQVRVTWLRSMFDAVAESLHVEKYAIWRQVKETPTLWDFIEEIPAVQFEEYSAVVPTLADSSADVGIQWSVFRVSAQFQEAVPMSFSPPDSGYSVDNTPPGQISVVHGVINGGGACLTWDKPADSDVKSYKVYRSSATDNGGPTFVLLKNVSTNSCVDAGALQSKVYFYSIVPVDSAGNAGHSSDPIMVSALTGVGSGETRPTTFSLSQNYPNPFNPMTTITFTLPRSAFVQLSVYNILGQEVSQLVHEQRMPGVYNVQFNASALSSGVYFYRLMAGGYLQIKKMVLVK